MLSSNAKLGRSELFALIQLKTLKRNRLFLMKFQRPQHGQRAHSHHRGSSSPSRRCLGQFLSTFKTRNHACVQLESEESGVKKLDTKCYRTEDKKSKDKTDLAAFSAAWKHHTALPCHPTTWKAWTGRGPEDAVVGCRPSSRHRKVRRFYKKRKNNDWRCRILVGTAANLS